MAYLPEAGDLAWIDFDPQAGHEQAKNRPALVMTTSDFNKATGLLLACPVTRTERRWRTRIPLFGTATTGFIMVEQLKSLDWRARRGFYRTRSPSDISAGEVARRHDARSLTWIHG